MTHGDGTEAGTAAGTEAGSGSGSGRQPELIATQAEFGAALTALREQAGLTVREAARRCGLATATAGGYFAGTHLPTPKLLDREFTLLLRAIGVADETELKAWREAARRLRRSVRRKSVATEWELPYRGLARFEPQDAPWFFGRGELTATLVERAQRRRALGAALVVVGPSGAGKSSVLRAGLIPVLRESGRVALFTPGRDPLASLDLALSGSGSGPGPARWIVVDQFEELFTHEVPAERRAAFVDALLLLAASGGTGVSGDRIGVVIGMRADFYAQALALPRLAAEFQDGQVLVGAMDRAQLREAIAGPARRAGAGIEDGLVELLIEQSVELGRENAGTLPLLSHALLTTWRQHEGAVLTTADYLATGGITHAIAQSAEEAYNELTGAQQDLARRLFLHLVHVAEGAPDTARRVDPAQLPGAVGGADLTDAVGVFVDRRLLTADADALQITHEALIGSWPRLRGWLDADRAGLLAQRRVAAAAEAWRDSGRDPAVLLRGAPLAAAEARAQESREEQQGRGWPDAREADGANASEGSDGQEGPDASERPDGPKASETSETSEASQKSQRPKESQGSKKARATSGEPTAAGLGGLEGSEVRDVSEVREGSETEAAPQVPEVSHIPQPPETRQSLSIGWHPTPLESEFLDASLAQRTAEESARLRATRRLRMLAASLALLLLVAAGTASYAFAQRGDAQNATRLADSQAVAGVADGQRGLDPSMAAQFSLDAYNIAPTLQSRSALLESTGTAQAARVVDGTSVVQALAVSRDGRLTVAADADGTVRLWDTAKPESPVALGKSLLNQSNLQLFAAAISPDRRLVAVSGAEDTISVWGIANPAKPVWLWNLTGPANTVYALAFNPQGTLLAAAGADGEVHLYGIDDTHSFITMHRAGTLATDPGDFVHSVAFSPDGRTLAAGTQNGDLRLWTLPAAPGTDTGASTETATGSSAEPGTDTVTPTADPSPPNLGGPVYALAFSPDGKLLATGTKTTRLQFWTVTGPGHVSSDGPAASAGTSWVNALVFSPDGTELAVATSAKNVQLWNPATRTISALLPHPEPVASVAWIGAHTVVSGCADGVLRFWRLPLPELPADGVVNSVAFSPDNTLMAVASDTLQLWDARTRIPLGAPLAEPGATPEATAFDPTAPLLAVGYSDGTLRVWNIADPAQAAQVGPALTASAPGYVESVAFNRTGTVLATGSDDATVRLFNLADPARPTAGKVLRGFAANVFSVAFDSDGTVLAAGSIDRSARLWQVTDADHAQALGAPLKGFPAYVYSVAFDPRQPLLAIGLADGTAQLFDVADPAHPASDGAPLTGPSGYTYALAFSPDGTLLAGADTDDSLWVWDVADPHAASPAATLTGATDSLYTVEFNPAGDTLAAGGADGTVRLWDPNPNEARQSLCPDIGQPLSATDWSRYAPELPITAPCG